MGTVFANIFVLIIIVELCLLSLQAEMVTATIGWVLASLLMVALVASVARKG
jgi:hypothetical protein